MTMFNKVVKSFQWGSHTVRMETGEIARQAGGAVLVDVDDTVILATVVGAKNAKPGQNFFPLTVDYLEKTYAAGKIPGGFFRREGRPSEGETLISRLIDRPLRPLFPEGFLNEVQVVIHVVSINPDVPADIPALIGASAALAVSGIPFNGPVGAARVGYKDGQYMLNPTRTEQATSQLDLIVAGTQSAVLMVESEAYQLSEEIMLGAVVYGHEQMQTAINAINDLVREGGKPEWDWQAAPKNEPMIAKVTALAEAGLREAYQIRQKQARSTKLKEVTKDVMAKLARCCTPVPGDAIVGFVTRGSGVSVHRSDCKNVDELMLQPERIMDVSWAPTTKSLFLVQIQIEALDRSGLLSDVTRVLSEHHVNILSASVSTRSDRVALSRFVFEMGDAGVLEHLLDQTFVVDAAVIGADRRRHLE